MTSETTAAHPLVHERRIDLDVVRAVALIGVCVMNYHGYLIGRGGSAYPPRNFLERVFDPWNGPLSTRFAATFVTVAGMGVRLFARRSLAGREPAAISADRWILLRRGVLLLTFGYFLDWVWSGTILFFYGAFFIAGAFIFTLRSRWLVAIGTGAALAAAALQRWSLHHDLRWLLSGHSEDTRSPRDLLFETLVRGTHPLLPWLVFFCMGMVLGRRLPFTSILRTQLAFAGVLMVAAGYLLRDTLPWRDVLRSTAPNDRGLLYVLTTVGSTLVAISVVGAAAEAARHTAIARWLAVTGRTTLTLYVLHVLAFNLLVDWLDLVHPGGLATALLFALGFWVFAIVAANAWARWKPVGPLEWVYRRFSA